MNKEQLRSRMKIAGTQREIASQMGISHVYLSNWIRGKQKVSANKDAELTEKLLRVIREAETNILINPT